MGRGTVIAARVRISLGDEAQFAASERVWLAADTDIETSTTVRIGHGTTVQRRCSINGSVRIGRGCIFGPNVFISSGTHPFRFAAHLPIREQERLLAEGGAGASAILDRAVSIQDDCWLGVNVVVCPGVTVGKGSVIGANAVVTRDVRPYSVVAGAPARVVGARLQWVPPHAIRMDKPEDWVYVLAGLPATDGSRVVEASVTADEALLAIVARPEQGLRIAYRATEAMEIRIGTEIRSAGAGEGIVEVTGALRGFGTDGVALDMARLPSSARGEFFVLEVRCF